MENCNLCLNYGSWDCSLDCRSDCSQWQPSQVPTAVLHVQITSAPLYHYPTLSTVCLISASVTLHAAALRRAPFPLLSHPIYIYSCIHTEATLRAQGLVPARTARSSHKAHQSNKMRCYFTPGPGARAEREKEARHLAFIHLRSGRCGRDTIVCIL